MKEDRCITDMVAAEKQEEWAAARKATAERKAAREAAKLQRDIKKQQRQAISKVARQRTKRSRQPKLAAEPLFAITLGTPIEESDFDAEKGDRL